MHTCGFCKDPIKEYDKPRKTHLVIAKTNDDHIHTHGDLEKTEEIKELFETAAGDLGLSLDKGGTPPKEVVFHNRQRIGDILMFTCAVRDFKAAFPNTRVNVTTTAKHIWDHNPHIDRTLEATPENTVKIGPGKGTNQSNRIDWHFANAYRISMEDALKVHIQQGESRPDIWLTEEEYHAPRLFDKPYWVICITGEKGWGCKMYPYEKWQAVVDQNPDLTFVQIGAKEDNPPRLKGSNVIDHVGQTQDKHTGIRDLYKLFLNAEGSIGLVSFHMHLSGALHKPAVVVAGAREPVSFTRFPYHQYLSTDGTMKCSMPACWHCNIEKCTNLVETPEKYQKKVPKCVDMITPEEITAAINRYYVGGRLKKGIPCDKPKWKNLVKTPVKVEKPEGKEQERVMSKFGLEWGRGSVSQKDWEFMEDVIHKHAVKNVIEFGAGLSTLLLSEKVNTISYETEDSWIDKITDIANKADSQHTLGLCKWNGHHFFDKQVAYDLAFVDGPANSENRNDSTRLAANMANLVIVHDAFRPSEKKWQEKFLKAGFDGPIRGGTSCHLWVKTQAFVDHPEPVITMNPNKKKVKIVSTARGWGGCARSVTTIMKLLLDAGHEVEFTPFRKQVTSKEFINALENGLLDVRVRPNYEGLDEPCDVLLMYADDFVWEFPKPENVKLFSGLNANRKVMMLNYRRGKIGEVEWTRNWDKYLFLNSGQQKELLNVHPGVETDVYPPCTDLTDFLEMKPVYNGPLKIMRHNSQGDTKFDKEKTPGEIKAALDSGRDVKIHMMPGPSFVPTSDRFIKHARNQPKIPQFLALGNMFWYSLPDGYMDMGPRVILEAMAAGLPILADPWGGAVDRVTPETGWLCSKEEQIEIIKTVTIEELQAKGQAAKERARTQFMPERWIEELTGEKTK